MNYVYCFPDGLDIIPEPYTINCVDDYVFSCVWAVLNDTVIRCCERHTEHATYALNSIVFCLFGCLDSFVE